MPITQDRMVALCAAAQSMRGKLDALRAACAAQVARVDSDAALAEIALLLQSTDYAADSSHVATIVREQTHFEHVRHANRRNRERMERQRNGGNSARKRLPSATATDLADDCEPGEVPTVPTTPATAEWSEPARFDDDIPDGDLGL